MITRVFTDTGNDAGFSLIETLFALAIMSLASLALFQSTSSILGLSDRAVKAAERTVNSGLDRLAVHNIIAGFLPSWPTEQDGIFDGKTRTLSGITTGGISQGAVQIERVTLSFVPLSNGKNVLMYNSAQSSGGWIIMDNLAENMQFEYMGVDTNWYAIWPPKTLPKRGYFDEDLLLNAPSLPQAVRARSGNNVIWIARVSRAATPPDRLDIEAGI